MTNGEKIKAMGNWELADAILKGISSDPCDYCKYNGFYCGTDCKFDPHQVILNYLIREAEE